MSIGLYYTQNSEIKIIQIQRAFTAMRNFLHAIRWYTLNDRPLYVNTELLIHKIIKLVSM